MTEGNAIFLVGLILAALGLSICTFIFKYVMLGTISGLAWLIVGAERIINRASAVDGMLSGLFIVLGVAMLFSPIIIRQKPEPTAPEQRERPTDRLAKKLDKYNNTVNRFKSK